MRVAIDATVLGSERGGDETLLRGLLAGLAEVVPESGDMVFPLFLRPGVEVPAAVATRAAFPIRRLRARSRALRYGVELPRLLLREAPRPDLVYTQTHAPLLMPCASLLQLTDLSFHHYPEFYPPLTRLRLRLLVPLHVARARAILTISEFSRQDILRTYGVAPERVWVVPCGVAAPVDAGPSAGDGHRSWLASRGITGPYFVYVGNLHPRKNLHRLVAAFLELRHADPDLAAHQLVLVGTEHEFYRRVWTSELRQLRERAGRSIVLVGRTSNDERDRLVRGAVALAYPSIFEGFGLPPVEALAVGTPVLASTTSAMPEVLGDAALLVDPFDVQAIAGGLARLAREPALRAELRERGLRRARLYATRVSGERAVEALRWVLGDGAEGSREGASWLEKESTRGIQSCSSPGSSATRFNLRHRALRALLSLAKERIPPSSAYTTPHETSPSCSGAGGTIGRHQPYQRRSV